MNTARLEAFSDGVIAILITIMVLELHVPAGTDFAALRTVAPTFLSYVLSFMIIGIYWNSHHHLFQAARRVNGRILWANLHLLFWLSLIPFTSRWLGDNYTAAVPTAIYGVVLLLSGVAYVILQARVIALDGRNSAIARALESDVKGKISVALNVAAVALAFVRPWIAEMLYAVGALIWFVPDPRIEHELSRERTAS